MEQIYEYEQTVPAQIRLFLNEQSDHNLHRFPVLLLLNILYR